MPFTFVNRFTGPLPSPIIVRVCGNLSTCLTDCRHFVNMPETRHLDATCPRKTSHERMGSWSRHDLRYRGGTDRVSTRLVDRPLNSRRPCPRVRGRPRCQRRDFDPAWCHPGRHRLRTTQACVHDRTSRPGAAGRIRHDPSTWDDPMVDSPANLLGDSPESLVSHGTRARILTGSRDRVPHAQLDQEPSLYASNRGGLLNRRGPDYSRRRSAS